MRHINQKLLFGADMLMDGFLRQEDLSATVMREIVPLIRHEDFADMYREGGRPPLSPKVLLMVTIFQFLEGLSDRAKDRRRQ
jgi:transposase